jgi:sugar/nucleoside kinase (ribokinase family)
LSSLDTVLESVASGRSTSTLCVMIGAVAIKISSSFASDDAFMAGLIYGYLDGSDFAESCRFALACAALSRASVSVNNPTLSADNALYLLANPA